MDEVAASRRKVWFALLLAAAFLVALSVALTTTPSSHPLRVEAAAAATVGHTHATARSAEEPRVAHDRSPQTTAAPPSTAAASTTTVTARVALARSTGTVVSHHVAAAATPTTEAPAPTTTTAPPPTIPPSAAAFLACIRMRESHDNYSAVSPDGTYRGAYQFTQDSWDMAAAHAGRHDLVGVRPDRASPASQDAVALALYEWMGSAPWGGACS